MSDRFYTPGLIVPGEMILHGPEAHHLGTVRRLSVGDSISLFNGDGFDYPAEIVAIARNQAVLSVSSPIPIDRELPFPLIIACAVPKGDRADFLVEKLTELGVRCWIPLQTERSIVHPRESRIEKWRQAVIEASKQCGRSVLMEIKPLTPWKLLIRDPRLTGMRVVCHVPIEGHPPAGLDQLPFTSVPRGVTVAIGPEGGFTASEVETAEQAGWLTASLGGRVLRVETAAIAAAVWAGLSPVR